MSIALHPDHMTAAGRLDEIAEILATGAMRLMARKSTRLSAERGDCSVDFTANRSVYGVENKRRNSRK
ncbi:hypothetical protein [Magnetospirillum sp. SS-4]|uniref:hypothetical protein n=1 Tax=Magnetospirillum sp. SS-4 TaxID=2681465 RepID=UPI00137FBC9C|nr:hypothetical protein [Magnetospirillum sp. SS-4]CAA7618235.1 conserved hypothetical protein [Magnetospirillum sp. SS-4]